ncbi:MAG TPA: hypothetical protein VF150_03920, partial [Thermoanaerobaculia bacterium]
MTVPEDAPLRTAEPPEAAAPTVSTAVASPASLRALELPGLLAMVAELAATDLGRERVLGLEPASDEEDLAARRRRHEEAARLLE